MEICFRNERLYFEYSYEDYLKGREVLQKRSTCAVVLQAHHAAVIYAKVIFRQMTAKTMKYTILCSIFIAE